tara:strand:- start:294 stop:590 length:297 start_codon:yes stop_codon:yes gene_type:complete
MDITDNLISKLEQISTETHLPLEKRLIDTAVWYHKNKDRIPRSNVEKRLEFLEKTFDIFIEMMAMQVERVQQMEGYSSSDSLWLPIGMSFDGDLKKYG